MPKQELLTGLKNAIERGETLQSAINSLTSAGYSSQEVKEASHYVYSGVLPDIESKKREIIFPEKKKPLLSKLFSKEKEKTQPQKSKKTLIIILATIFILLLILLILTIAFKDTILSWFS